MTGLLTVPWAHGRSPAGGARTAKPRLQLHEAPLTFEPNRGQVDGSVAFIARGLGGTLFFRAADVVLSLPAASTQPRPVSEGASEVAGEPTIARVRFLDARPAPRLVGARPQAGRVNYLFGEAAGWISDIPTYAGLRYEGLYPGIDLVYEVLAGRLKATYEVSPGADPARIRWAYPGAQAVRIDRSTGDLHITLAGPGNPALIEQAPVAWQEIEGRRVLVDVGYVTGPDGSVRFAPGE